jgi:hypothetical protein
MSSFDLNINNYNINELINMMELIQPYTQDDIISKKNMLQERILTENSISMQKKTGIYNFFNKASEKLLSNIKEIPNVNSIDSNEINTLNTFNEFKNNKSNFIIDKSNNDMGVKNSIRNGRTMDAEQQPVGIMNPINIRTIKHTVNIDTRFRPNYYSTLSTKFSLVLPLKISNAVSMRVGSIEIPTTWYTISKNSGNSFFKIEWGYNETNKTYEYDGIVNIPDGNYEPYYHDSTKAVDISSIINSYMHSLYADDNDTTANNLIRNLYFNVDRTSGKSGFAWMSDPGITPSQFRITFSVDFNGHSDIINILQFKIGWLLGFRIGSYTGLSVVSEGICFLKSPRYAFISITDYNNSVNNNFSSAFSSSLLQKDIIARINLTFIQQNQGIYQSGQDDGFSTQINRQRSYFGPVNIERLEIKLLDEYGRIIDLNNMDWSMTLTMECLYDN